MAKPIKPLPPDDTGMLQVAQSQARKHGNAQVGSEHILLALLENPRDPTTHLLRSFTLRAPRVVFAMERVTGRGGEPHRRTIPFNPASQAIARNAVDIAVLLGSPRVESSHYLLGLLAEDDSVAVEIIRNLLRDPHELAERAMQLLGLGTWPSQEPRVNIDAMTSPELRAYLKENDELRLKIDLYYARRHGRDALAERLARQLEAIERHQQRDERFKRLFAMERGRLLRRIEIERQRQEQFDATGEQPPDPANDLPEETDESEGNGSEDRP